MASVLYYYRTEQKKTRKTNASHILLTYSIVIVSSQKLQYAKNALVDTSMILMLSHIMVI